MPSLLKDLSAKDLIGIGVGNVIGSGIFVLFASILGKAKHQTFLALVLAAIPNLLSGLTYAELASMYQNNTIEYDSLRDAFGDTLATIANYLLIGFLVFNTTTIILFASEFLGFDMKFLVSVSILFVMSLINFFGIDISKQITNIVALIEILTLGAIALRGIPFVKISHINFHLSRSCTFMTAVFLAFFLYTGYDSVVKLSEEAKRPAIDIPIGTLGAILIPMVLYISLGAIGSSLSLHHHIAESHNPISYIAKIVFSSNTMYTFVSVVGIMIVINAFFISLLSLSRLLYGMSKQEKLPKELSNVGDRFHTPGNAIIATFILVGLAMMVDSGEKSASFANFFALALLLLLNIALLVLRKIKTGVHREFKVPLNIMFREVPIPLPTILGVLSCIIFIVMGIICFSDIK